MPELEKIGYLVPQFPGQTHVFFWREILAMEKAGVEVCLFSTRKPPPGLISHRWSKEAIARTEYLGAPTLGNALATLPRLPVAELAREAGGGAFWRDVLISAPAARRLAQSCARQGITHVHAHSCGRAALIVALAHQLYGLSYSLTLHGALSDYGPGQGFKWRGAKFATVITRALMADIMPVIGADMPERTVIQPMGVDTDILTRDAPYVPPRPDEQLRLFSCGRLNMAKGHQDTMQAVRLLLDRGVNVALEIAGEDDLGGHGYRKELETQVVALGLQQQVTLLGAVDAGAIRDKLQAAHLFVLPSWREALGVAYMEAMSCGVPTIGTTVGGVGELIDDGVDGLLLDPQQPALLAETIAGLAADPERCLRFSAAGRATVVRRFNAAVGAQTLIHEAGR